MKTSVRSLLFLALLVPGSANAEAQKPVSLKRADFVAAMDAEFRKLDLDSDHVANSTEIAEAQRKAQAQAAIQRLEGVFKQLDKNKDGKLSNAEFRVIAAGQNHTVDPAPILRRFDSNRDGTVAIIEYRIATQANFDRIDVDRDGLVNASEMARAGGIK